MATIKFVPNRGKQVSEHDGEDDSTNGDTNGCQTESDWSLDFDCSKGAEYREK